jgi:hypothetical protein
MGPFRKKPDPISDRKRELNQQIAALEATISKLTAEVEQTKTQPHVRSTVFPHAQTNTPPPAPPTHEPIFEEVDQGRISAPPDTETTAAHYNDGGIRKFDLFAFGRRLRKLWHGPPPANPQLVHLLAAGSIRGVRPLRYEKRVARNRFILLVVIFALVLWGIIALFFRNR